MVDDFRVVKLPDESYSYEGSLGAYENGELTLGDFTEVIVVDGVVVVVPEQELTTLLNDDDGLITMISNDDHTIVVVDEVKVVMLNG